MNDDKEYDDTNKGAMFKSGEDWDYKVGFIGPGNVNGHEGKFMYIKVTTPNGKVYYSLAQEVARLWPNQFKKENHQPDYTGYNGEEREGSSIFASIWKRISKEGIRYLSVILTKAEDMPKKKEEQPNKRPSSHGIEEDEIPF